MSKSPAKKGKKPPASPKNQKRVKSHPQLLDSVFDSMNEGIIVVDKDFHIQLANKFLVDWIKREKSDVVGQHCYKVIHQRDDICPDCGVNKTFKTGKPSYACHTGIAKDGSKTYAELFSYPILNEKGEVALAVEKAVDVSERKRAVEAIEESEERLRLITETIDEVFWLADLDLEHTYYVSPAYSRIFGRSCESLYQNPRSFIDIVHPEDRPGLVEVLERKRKNSPFSVEYRLVLPNGEIRHIWDRGYPVRRPNGEVDRYAGVAQDITQRKIAEESLSLLSKAVEQSADMVVITDSKGVVQYVNPAFSLFTGLPMEKVVGDVLPKPYEKFAEIWHGETEIPNKSGKDATVNLTVSPLVDERGRTTGSVGLGRDMTDNKYLQERLFQSERLVGLGTLASGIAHEINNPLSGILGMAEAIRDENDPALIKSYANDIVQYTLEATNIVKELSSYARLEPDETTSTINVADVMEKSLKIAAHSAPLDLIKVNSDLQGDCLVIGNRGLFQQVFVNLMVNAIHAMDEKGALSLECWKNGDFVIAKVTDTGKGIPKEDLKKVFDPFFTTKPVGKGTGLGLYVVYKIIMKYQGRIEIESGEGKGTSFILQFPALKSADSG